MKLADFFREHPVFTIQELNRFLAKAGSAGNRQREALLAYHIKAGHLIRLKRELYAVVAKGSSPKSYAADPYLIAGKLREDTVIAYHTALAFYGKSHSITHQFCAFTHKRPARLIIQGNIFRLVSFPRSLIQQQQSNFGVKTIPYQGSELRVTSFERTLVDMLDRPTLSGEWEEIWRSLESVEYFDIEKILEYALLLNKATTIALVGFYLEQHRQTLRVKDSDLMKLQAHSPKKAHYVSRSTKIPSQFIARWNLMIPKTILEQSWEEPT